MKTGDAVRYLRKLQGLSQEALDAASGVGTGYTRQIEAGRIERPGADKLAALAKALRVSMDTLMSPPQSVSALASALDRAAATQVQPTNGSIRQLPLLTPLLDWWDVDVRQEAQTEPGLSPDPQAFYIVANGAEMTGAAIPAGAKLLVHPGDVLTDGNYVLVRSESKTAVRVLRVRDGRYHFSTLNTDQSPIVLGADDVVWRIKHVVTDLP